MTPKIRAAVIDTLLPGDDVLPSGTRAGVRIAEPAAHKTVLSVISLQAGGSDAFAGATEEKRVGVLQIIERAYPDAFRALVVAVLSEYYETPAVLTGLGWRIDPPQPTGRAISEAVDAAAELLDRVRQRPKLWRS